MALYLIEHLEPRIYNWCKLEYAHISSVVGADNLVIFNTRNKELAKFAHVEPNSIHKIHIMYNSPCVLDPEAPETLTPEIALEHQNFIFGGILGDYPPRKRTQEEVKLPYPRYNLGKDQMSTDTAVIVTHKIVNGTPLSEMKFKDGIDVDISKGESIHLPYKYLLVDGKPLLPKGLIEMLKKRKGF
ncbi:hypothetical protein J4219_03595 [Candidatus Woesearchaeota archaeon]|nr:hypothetical protein [Candidatus Woesearchaeota archaeon]